MVELDGLACVVFSSVSKFLGIITALDASNSLTIVLIYNFLFFVGVKEP